MTDSFDWSQCWVAIAVVSITSISPPIDDHDYASHVDTIHINPVKHGYVARADDWPHSSIHPFIARGVIDTNWASSFEDGKYGER